MNFKELDKLYFTRKHSERVMKARERMRERAEEMGYEYISEAIVSLYEEFGSIRPVAKALGVYYNTIYNWLKIWRVDVDSRDQDTGATLDEIAEEFGYESRRGALYFLESAMKKFRRNWIRMYGEPPEVVGKEMDFFENVLRGYAALESNESEKLTEAEMIKELAWIDVEDKETPSPD